MTSSHERIPTLSVKLSGQIDYVEWLDAAEAMLDYYDIFEVVNGTIKPPVAPTAAAGSTVVATEEVSYQAEKKAYEKQNKWARAFIIHNIERDVHKCMAKSRIASEMWKSLEDMFNRKTTSTLHQLVGNLMTLRYTPEITLKDHVATFANQWNILLERTTQHAKDTDGFGFHMHGIAKDAKSKAAFLILSIQHETMENVIDNLQTKADLTYEDAYEKLIDLSTRREQSKEAEVLQAARTLQRPDNGKECAYCKERNTPYKGHLAKECRKKKAAKQASAQANTTVADMNSSCFMVHSSLPAYTSFLNSTWINCEYPDYSTPSDLTWMDNIEDLNWVDTCTFLPSIALTTGSSSKNEWIFDTGASDHMTGTSAINIRKTSSTVTVAGGQKLQVTGIGEANLLTSIGPIHIKKVLIVPELGESSLISWQKLAAQGYKMIGEGNEIRITINGTIKAIAKLSPDRGLYMIKDSPSSTYSATTDGFHVWHTRLGHLPASSLSKLRSLVIDPQSLPIDGVSEDCSDCLLGKSKRLPVTGPGSTTKAPLELIHSDLSGRFSLDARGGFRYYITFIDDYTRYTYVYLLKTKDGALAAFKTYVAQVENILSNKVKRFRSDRGGEYMGKEFMGFLEAKGIISEPTTAYSHQSNGVAERYNQTIGTMIRVAFISSRLPKNLWGEAVSMMVHVKNRLPHSLLQATPFEVFFGKKPSVAYFRTFGDTGYSHISEEARPAGTKLEPRATEIRICGYGPSQGIYRVYDPVKQRVFMSRNVRFPTPFAGEDITRRSGEAQKESESEEDGEGEPESEEDEEEIKGSEDEKEEVKEKEKEEQQLTPGTFIHSPSPKATRSTIIEDLLSDDDEDVRQLLEEAKSGLPLPAEPLSDEEYLREMRRTPLSSKRFDEPSTDQEKTVSLGPNVSLRRSSRHKKPIERYGSTANLTFTEPSSYKEAITAEDSVEWKDVMQEEYDALVSNGTWEVIPRPEGKKVVGSRWHYVLKLGPEGEVLRHKARFVARGFSQIEGIDYQETFSPVFRYESLRMIFALVATLPQRNWKTKQRDVKNAFLNASIKETVMVEQPKGFEVGIGNVLKLRKTLYGLKQSPRAWHDILCEALEEKGIFKTNFDPSIFVNKERTVIIAAFVDDLGSFFSDPKAEAEIFCHLEKRFRMTGGEEISWMVGINVIYSASAIRLTQTAYLQRVLKRFGMEESRAVSTPFENHGLTKHEGEAIETTEFQAIVGSLMYAAIGTRPDIAFSTICLSQFASHPGPDHWIAVKRILRYIKGTLDFGLTYPRTANQKVHLVGYADASYASNIPDRRSFSGNCFFVNGCLVSWKTSKQKSVATSTTEAEYMSLSEAARQLVWMKRAIKNLGFQGTYELLEDNTGAKSLAENPVFHTRSKHIDVHFHFVREKLARKVFTLSYVPTGENVADLFTKGLGKTKHQLFSSKIHCDSSGEVLK